MYRATTDQAHFNSSVPEKFFLQGLMFSARRSENHDVFQDRSYLRLMVLLFHPRLAYVSVSVAHFLFLCARLQTATLKFLHWWESPERRRNACAMKQTILLIAAAFIWK